jgi:outer membrane lipase/esterase
MSSHWMRRAVLALAIGCTALLAACGSGTIESQLQPSRIVAFGDGFSDLGQVGGLRYTVNDGTVNVWSQQLAVNFGLSLLPTINGGTSYAIGNARISTKPDAAGNDATPTVTQQVDQFLAGNAIGTSDLLVINGGISDIVAEVAKVDSGAQTADQAVANAKQAGRDLGGQVRRLVQAGAAHVVVVGSYDLGKSPWALTTSQQNLLSDASGRFNDQLLLSIVDLGANVLYVDAALLFNLMVSAPTAYQLTNSTDMVCTVTDPGAGIGTGPGQVNSALCTPGNTLANSIYTQFLFADRVYPAPQAHRNFGSYAFDRIRARW